MNNQPALFAYGTLMFPAIIGEVIGRIPPGRPGVVHGYQRLEVAGHSFPGLIADPSSAGVPVNGILYHDLSAAEWQRLDDFEDDFYVLSEIPVLTPEGNTVTALVYLVPESARNVLSDRPWSGERFQQTHLGTFLSGR